MSVSMTCAFVKELAVSIFLKFQYIAETPVFKNVVSLVFYTVFVLYKYPLPLFLNEIHSRT